MGLFVKQKDWLLLVKYFKMVCVCIWKQGTYFPKESAFSKGYRKLFLKEIHNYFWNFFALKVSSLQGILIHISSWTIQYMYLFSVLNKKKIQTPQMLIENKAFCPDAAKSFYNSEMQG